MKYLDKNGLIYYNECIDKKIKIKRVSIELNLNITPAMYYPIGLNYQVRQ